LDPEDSGQDRRRKFRLLLDKQRIKVVKGKIPRPDLVMVVEDPAHLIGWTNGDSLVNLRSVPGVPGSTTCRIWETIFKFDRLPGRSGGMRKKRNRK